MPALPPELRRVAPASFVEERDRVARRLRQEGDRDAAAAVRRLRRPSAPLWALNQLAVTVSDRVAELIRAGQALRETTQAALQGQGAELGRLSNQHARLVDELTGRAMDLLAELPAPATREAHSRVWTMLRLASLDPALAPALAEGSLAEEPAGGGFEGLLGLEPDVSPAAAVPEGEDRTAAPEVPKRRPTAQAAEARRRLEREQEAREAQARVDQATAETARRRDRRERTAERVTRLRSQLEAAQQEAEQVERELAAAEEELKAARELLERLRANGRPDAE